MYAQFRCNPFYLLLLCGLIAAFVIPAHAASSPSIGGVSIFPPDDIWNVPVDTLPVDPHSADYVKNIGTTAYLHPDFGSGLWEGSPMGIPYNIVPGTQQKKTVTFDYADESDPGPYPIPDNPVMEGGSDRHILILDRDNHILYELFAAVKQPDGSWDAGSGAIFNLSDYRLRPSGWTSADAAGLAILPGLVRYDEVAAGEIDHAIRFTAPSTRRAYVWPARHYASSITNTAYPPMGQKFRLKSSFDTSGYPTQARVILEALKKYGMILSDNGAPWYITGAPDDRWDNDALHTLQQLKGSDFEAVDSSSLMISPDSGQARTTYIPDTIPPRSIANLANTTYQPGSITWAWTDPADADFARVMVYLNGAWKADVTKGTRSWTASGLLPDTAYTIGTRTVDSGGNINASWVNQTARTSSAVADNTPPRSVANLTNTTYQPGSITWAWMDPADADFARVMVYFNGAWKANVTKGTRSWMVSGLLPDTAYTIGTRTVDSGGNINASWVNQTARTAARSPAPTVSYITPHSGIRGTSVNVTDLHGSNFVTGPATTSVKLTKSGRADIVATGVRVISSGQIQCTLPVPANAATGSWNVVVSNPDGQSGTLSNGFSVTNPPPVITSITPDSGRHGRTVAIKKIAGANFQTGATIQLVKSGLPNISGQNVRVVSSGQITGTFTVPSNAKTGYRDLVVRNPDGGTCSLVNGFRVT